MKVENFLIKMLIKIFWGELSRRNLSQKLFSSWKITPSICLRQFN